MAYYQDKRIRINCLLNSSAVSAETMRFLLWHEFLHLYLKAGHTQRFRQLERSWQTCPDCDEALDTLAKRFDLGPMYF